MIVISPAGAEDRVTLGADYLGRLIEEIGTERFGEACFNTIERTLDAQHWALFHYQSDATVRCIATASRIHDAAARKNVDRFVSHCHHVDPSLMAVKHQGQGSTCLVKIDAEDIRDRQYRQCFDATRVQERLSLFSRLNDGMYQLSAFRCFGRRAFSSLEMQQFATVGWLILRTTLRHESIWRDATAVPNHSSVASMERVLRHLPNRLSPRECEVCARAIAGLTIEDTARELALCATSVITYRQRAYQKLGISRQSELMALVYNTRPDLPP